MIRRNMFLRIIGFRFGMYCIGDKFDLVWL